MDNVLDVLINELSQNYNVHQVKSLRTIMYVNSLIMQCYYV